MSDNLAHTDNAAHYGSSVILEKVLNDFIIKKFFNYFLKTYFKQKDDKKWKPCSVPKTNLKTVLQKY